MRRLLLDLAISLLVATVMVSADKTYPCGTFISAEPDGSGGINIPEPAPMQCGPDEEMVIAFVNKDTSAHRFQLRDIHCRDGKKEVKDPTKHFIKKPVDVDAGATILLTSGLFGTSKPKLLDAGSVKGLKCDSDNYSYKYTIRVSAKGDDDGGKKERDPDLEVSPPPSLTVKARKR